MDLAQVGENKKAVIKKLKNKNNIFLRRVEAMGLKVGEEVKVERKLGRNMVVSTEGRKIAIDRDLAKNIEVEPK